MPSPSAFEPSVDVYRGKRYFCVLVFETPTRVPVDVSARSYRAEVRLSPSSPLVASFACKTQQDDASLASNEVSLELLPAQTALLTAASYETDLEETVSGVPQILFPLRLSVLSAVTANV